MAGETDLLVAKARFYDYPAPGQPVLVLDGVIARAGHPIVDRNPTMFEPLQVDYDVDEPKKPGRKPTSG